MELFGRKIVGLLSLLLVCSKMRSRFYTKKGGQGITSIKGHCIEKKYYSF